MHKNKLVNLATLVIMLSPLQRFFDFNRDGFLDAYEEACLETYQANHWPLAKSKKKKLFDRNHNGMLEPVEYEKYLKALRHK